MAANGSHPLRALARAVSWHRRTLAVVCAVLAVLTTIMAIRPPTEDTVAVWVAKTDLPAGTELTESNTAQVGFVADSVPSARIETLEDVVGRRIAAPMTRGSPITRTSVVSGALARSGHALIPIRLADPSLLTVLEVGQTVDVHALAPGGGNTLVSRGARVAALPGDSQRGALNPSADSLVLLEVRDSDTTAVMANVTSITLALR